MGKAITFTCKQCLKTVTRPNKYSITATYCSNRCQKAFESETLLKLWLQGAYPGWAGKTRQLKPLVRNYIRLTKGTACEECGWDDKHPIDGKTLTEIDHVDGDAENCTLENLRVLCPNCHSKTHTFRARNKVSKRNRS